MNYLIIAAAVWLFVPASRTAFGLFGRPDRVSEAQQDTTEVDSSEYSILPIDDSKGSQIDPGAGDGEYRILPIGNEENGLPEEWGMCPQCPGHSQPVERTANDATWTLTPVY